MSKDLFQEFKPTSLDDWTAKITADLKGKDFDDTLVWKTIEGFNLQPNYNKENSPELNLQVKGNEWAVNQNILVSNIAEANKKALAMLNDGVSSLGFHFPDKCSKQEFDALLRDILIEHIQIHFGSKYPLDIMSYLRQHCEENNLAFEKVHGTITFDILYHINVAGNWLHDEAKDFDMLKSLVVNYKDFPKFKTVGVYSDSFHNAGANATQEVGLTIAKANEYISQMVNLGIDAKDVIDNLFFHFPVGNSYFIEIGKLKALNLLWKNLSKSYDCMSDMDLKCSTSVFYNSSLDAYNNLLRATSQSMAAILGGANMLTVTPHNSTYESNTDFGDRIAKNIQLVLKEESYFNKVSDPTAGTYYLNEITQQLSENAWKLFKSIEAEGGFIEACRSGFVQSNIQVVADKRIERFNNKQDILLGVNKYPNSMETAPEPMNHERDFGASEEREFTVLRPFRLAQQFELDTENV